MSHTPRTDALISWVKEYYLKEKKYSGTTVEMVSAEECRMVERELSESARKLEEAERAFNEDCQLYLNENQAAHAKIAELQQQLAEARKDAERYRWLKAQFYAVGSPEIYWNCRDFEPSEDSALVGSTLDEAIDAALEASK